MELVGDEMAEINIEEIMEEIRNEIKEKGINEELIAFSEASLPEFITPVWSKQKLQGDLQAASENYFVDPARKLTNDWKGLIKKLIRRVTQIYVRPLVEDQNLFNINTLDCMKQFYAYIDVEETYKRRQDRMMERLLHENKELQQQIEELRAKK